MKPVSVRSTAGRCIAASTRSGTLVGPGVIRKFRPRIGAGFGVGWRMVGRSVGPVASES